jgi:hypothetical protein
LVEGDKIRAEVPRAERLTRFNYDAPLIAAFMDQWRPETHTFHFPVSEMTLCLEDAAMLGGLSCAGEAMGPIDIPAMWQVSGILRGYSCKEGKRCTPTRIPL